MKFTKMLNTTFIRLSTPGSTPLVQKVILKDMVSLVCSQFLFVCLFNRSLRAELVLLRQKITNGVKSDTKIILLVCFF